MQVRYTIERTRPLRFPRLALLVGGISVAACGGNDEYFFPGTLGIRYEDVGSCSIPTGLIYSGGVGRDGIPALSDPVLVGATDSDARYLRTDDRVIGIEVDGEYIAIPHRILWHHEIVNFNNVEPQLSVTYCPLTGSSIVFDRSSAEGVEFGVSGLLFNNNLIMYDRATVGETSLWPQMMRQATCGPRGGHTLEMYPSVEIQWGTWVSLHPDTRVVSGTTGYTRDYQVYPYGAYERLHEGTIYPNEPYDQSRPPKERVLGVPFADGGGIAFPFEGLSKGITEVVHETVDGKPVVVFWRGEVESALAFWSSVDDQALTFEVRGSAFFDVETGSEWSLGGLGLSGTMEGRQLALIREAYVSFWFAWSTFIEDSQVWAP